LVNIDGTDLQYICQRDATPYFVPDYENHEQEVIMPDCGSHIDLMNMDSEIYIANIDGSALQNLTNTLDIWERDPAFSPDNQRIKEKP